MMFATYILRSFEYLNIKGRGSVADNVVSIHPYKKGSLEKMKGYFNPAWVLIEEVGPAVVITKLKGFDEAHSYYKELGIINTNEIKEVKFISKSDLDNINWTCKKHPTILGHHKAYQVISALDYPKVGDLVRGIAIENNIVPELSTIRLIIKDYYLKEIQVLSKYDERVMILEVDVQC